MKIDELIDELTECQMNAFELVRKMKYLTDRIERMLEEFKDETSKEV